MAAAGFGGVQFAALQGSGSRWQTLTTLNGKLSISWLATGRSSFGSIAGGQSYIVKLVGAQIGGGWPRQETCRCR